VAGRITSIKNPNDSIAKRTRGLPAVAQCYFEGSVFIFRCGYRPYWFIFVFFTQSLQKNAKIVYLHQSYRRQIPRLSTTSVFSLDGGGGIKKGWTPGE